MIEISSLTALIVSELLIGLSILSALLVWFTLLRKRRIRQAASHLAERVQSDKPKRTERLKKLLEERYGYQDEILDQSLHNIMQTEMLLFQNVINGFLKDDQVHLQQMDVDVENLVLSFQNLELSEGAAAAVEAPSSDDEEVNHLKAENERLSDELRVTMDTMGRMLNEYSSMFSGGIDNMGGAKSQPAAAPDMETADEAETSDSAIESDQAGEQQPIETDAEATPLAEEELLTDENTSQLDDDTVIPDMTAEELQDSSYLEEESNGTLEGDLDQQAPSTAPSNLDESAEEVDEEVSEIIDEVMEIADEMIQDAEPAPTSEQQSESSGESLVDDLEKIDIEIPDVEQTPSEEPEFEAGSLEEEWAKLLEEESSAADEGKHEEKDP
ncbi:MAG: hypothetical protein KZQ88_12925 [Candidatus Thiodiazotropha sp. (ex Dulcina madagascariensis)]|nr:hypothetical protein [Candidatus Thiodiazotropha sp. (ex Dulcina madagascariensis)]MCU7926423.1 hypothetical protein [Candidatus Thiodiazotropha sp. (ex Dulcina madagascariensis)]